MKTTSLRDGFLVVLGSMVFPPFLAGGYGAKNKGKQAEQPLAFPVGSCFVIRPRSPSSVFALHNKQFSVCFYAFIVPFGKGMFQSIGFYFEWCSVYIIVRC
ncbi:MAG: hypothetical protein ACLS45_14150 [Subdoligranulum sp.]